MYKIKRDTRNYTSPLMNQGTSSPFTPRERFHYVRSLYNRTPRLSFNLLTQHTKPMVDF